MSTQELVAERGANTVNEVSSDEELASSDFVTMRVCGQLVGLPILSVQDILSLQKLTTIPLAPPEVAGSLNLRGRIVTAIDMRQRLALDKRPDDEPSMNVVVEHHGELYSLIIDAIGDVLSLPDDRFERVPPTLDPIWRSISTGVFRLDDEILVVLECASILDFADESA